MPRRLILLLAVVLALSPLPQSTSLTLAWDPATDGITTGYHLGQGLASHTYTTITDVGLVTQYTLTVTCCQTLYFAVRAYSASGAVSVWSDEVLNSWHQTQPPTPGFDVGLTATHASPQPVNTSITWTALATGDTPPYRYRWSIQSDGKATLTPWASRASLVWRPRLAGRYVVQVWARSAANRETTRAMPFTVTAALAAPPQPTPQSHALRILFRPQAAEVR